MYDNRVVVLIKVDDDGFEIEPVIFELYDIDGNQILDIPENLVPPNSEKRLWKPKWDFELKDWFEGDPELALSEVKRMLIEQYSTESIQYVESGFEYNGDFFAYSPYEQQQFTSQMMMFFMRPNLTSVKWSTVNNGIKTFTKDQFLSIYQAGEDSKLQAEEYLQKLTDYVNSMTDFNAVVNMPTFKEAINLIK